MTNTYYAYVSYTYNGGDRIFTIPFSYIKKEDIKVYVNSDLTTNYTFNTTSQISITDTLDVGDKIEIKRDSDVENRMVVFTNTSIMNKDNQNLAHQQTFNVVQEVHDDLALYTKDVEDIYPMLEKAYEHIDAIEGVYENRAKINTVADDLEDDDSNIKSVVTNMSDINTVVNNLDSIETVYNDVKTGGTNYTNTVATDLALGNNSKIKKVADINTDVTKVANIDTKVSSVADNETNINTVATDLALGSSSKIKKVSDNITNVNKVAGNESNVNKVAAIDSNVTTVAGISSDVTTVAGISTSVSAVASNTTNINAVNSNKTNIDAVAGNATNINAVNSNKTNINTVASNSSNINTVAGSISNVNTCATNITAITNAPTAASNAAQQAGIATAQANIATQQAALAKQYAQETHGASDATFSNLRALPAINNYEYPQTDEDGLNDLIEEYHSTYCGDQASTGTDPKKFTKSASWAGNITADGIASGFSSNSYIAISPVIQLGTYDNWTLDIGFTTRSDITTFQAIFYANYGIWYGGVQMSINNGNFIIIMASTTSTDRDILLTSDYAAKPNTDYKFKIEFTGSQYTIYCSENGNGWVIVKRITSSTKVYNAWQNMRMGLQTGGSYPFLGSIDLKQFKIIANGVPVFSGNQTGIDTIKPINYTAVNNPTISDDGIASGFSDSKYITVPSIFLSGDSWKIEYPISATQTNQAGLISILSDSCMQIVYTPNTKTINYALSSNNSSWDIGSGSFVASDLDNTKDSTFTIEFTGTQYNLNIYQNNVSVGGISINSSTKLYQSSNKLVLGNNRGLGAATNGSIDLNAFKIYIDGDLVYQPCLKIPYTLSKTGSKIVDYIYRDRVSDMYEQFGYAPYFTLKEDGIKANDITFYTVGSPTLIDGVASGFSANDYFKTNLTFAGSYTLSIKFKTLTMTNAKYYKLLYINDTSGGITLRYHQPYQVDDDIINDSFMSAAHQLFFTGREDNWLTENTNYLFTLYYDGEGNCTATLKNLDNGVVITDTQTSASPLSSGEWLIGSRGTGTDYFTGEIYLNSLKIKYDIETLNSLLAHFTVPQGNLYGMIGQQTLRQSTVSGINRSFLYSDRTLLLTGSCTSGVEVTLPKPFINSNYMLSVPYSAKTATAFTPTQTGDWFAIGEGEL